MLSLVRRSVLRPRQPLLCSFSLATDSKWDFINDRITARVVTILDDNGDKRNDVPLHQALQEAKSQDVDLVQVSPKGRSPTVCRLFDAQKRLYEMKKAAKKASKDQKPKPDKEVMVGVKIAPNDLNFKVEQLKKFLSKGHKVKVFVKFGNAYHLKPQSLEQLERIQSLVGVEFGAPSGPPRLQFGGVYVYYSPAN